MNLKEYSDRELLAMSVANVLAGELKNVLTANDKATFAVPGGTTPGPIFDMLSSTRLDWSSVRVLLTDERWVPESDDQSNAALVRKRLLTEHAAAARFMPFYRDGMTAQEAAEDIAPMLEPELPLSVLLLGMGTDMHTASLFPGMAEMNEALDQHAPALIAVRPEGQPTERVTLSGRVLQGALATHLVVFGEEKRAALERAARLSPKDAPIALVLEDAKVHYAP